MPPSLADEQAPPACNPLCFALRTSREKRHAGDRNLAGVLHVFSFVMPMHIHAFAVCSVG